MSVDTYYQAALEHLQQNSRLTLNLRHIDFSTLEKNAKQAISRNLIGFRSSLGLSQGAFANILGISRSQYRKYENGDEIIRLDVAQRITLKCGLPLFHLLQGSQYEEQLKVPPKKAWFDRVLFYANSLEDSAFKKLCSILAIFTDSVETLSDFQDSRLSKNDFALALRENAEQIYIAIADGVRAVRTHFGKTQEEIAAAMGVSITTYQDYEKAAQRPRFNMLMAVRWTLATGIHPFVALAGTHFVKIRYMQSYRLEILEKLLAACNPEEAVSILPLVEGFYHSIENQADAFLFTIEQERP